MSSTLRSRLWVVVAVGVLVAGVVVSVASGLLWRSSVRMRDKQSFQTAATDVAKTLEMELQRDSELVTTLRGIMTMQPNLSATRFNEVFSAIEGQRRLVGGLGTLIVRSIPAHEVASFQRRRNAEPAFQRLVSGAVSPPLAGNGSARHCLLVGGSVTTPYTVEVAHLVQSDWCNPHSPMGSYPAGSTSQAKMMISIAASGRTFVYPVTAQGESTFFIEAPFYARGLPLRTEAQRLAAILGWASSSFDIPALIHSATEVHRGFGVTLEHANPGQPFDLIGRTTASTRKAFSHRATIGIDGTWRVIVRGTATTTGMSATLQGLLIFLVGMVASGLLCALLLILGRSRAHALGLVEQKTGQLRHQALHDALTGLPNRVLALDRAEQMLARARRQHTPVAALYIDVDGFKHVNDTFGHAAGDKVLELVANRLASVIREGDTAARLGGDEFVVLVEGSSLNAGPEIVAERILEVLRQPYDMNGEIGRELSLTASIGIAYGARDSADDLLRDADLALYAAKAAGKNCDVLFQAGMKAAAQDRTTLRLDLAEALEHEQFFLLYQPTFELQSGKVIGVEALIRWRHPTRGLIAPLDFIPIAEETGLIMPIGRWVLDEACRQAAAWHQSGHEIGMAVNVSGRQLDHASLVDDVREALAQSGLHPTALTLEITETTLMRDANATAERLRALKRLGVRIAIDDFGTGYSSLAYLRQFPVDALKIDRSFIDGIANSKESAALIQTLVQLGKTLSLDTLAEGIEEQAQLQTLQREHCDHGQGFLLSRPLEVAAIEAFLTAEDSTAILDAQLDA